MDSNKDSDFQAAAPTIRVDACKYDGSVHRSWSCRLLEETADLYTLHGVFEREIKHPLLGTIESGTVSVEYYWKKRWYNVFKFYEPDQTFRNYYCNVNTPPEFSGGVLKYVDLDIDVLVKPDLSYQILDADEFAENAVKHQYPIDLIERANRALDQILDLIKTKRFPFAAAN